MFVYITLFSTAFVAATLLPAQSELVLAYDISVGNHPVWALVFVASVGNILGSIVNWTIGRYLRHYQGKSWFPATPKQMQRAQQTYEKYGRYSLLASWVPIIGDPLTVIAGILGEPLWRFVLFVSIAKTGRYILVALTTVGLSGSKLVGF